MSFVFFLLSSSLAGEPCRVAVDCSPPGLHLESKPITGLIVAGAAAIGGLWAVTWAETWAGCQNCSSGVTAASFVPVFGPFIEAALIKPQDSSNILAAFLVLDGFFQSAGAALIVIGSVLHRDVLVYDVGPVRGAVMPTGSKNSVGLSLVGQF
jgi:hypothetical protein